jgi:predicted DNA-binding WGR domain protein
MEIYLVFVDAIQNSNKFWSAKVEDGNLTVQWGRVSYEAQTKRLSAIGFSQTDKTGLKSGASDHYSSTSRTGVHSDSWRLTHVFFFGESWSNIYQ